MSGDTSMHKRYELSVQATADVTAIRRESFQEREHLVVPVVALVEGVLHPSNAPFEELALASEFGKHPEGWNGRPIVLGHPQRKGAQVSANSPSVLEEEAFGMLFNTQLDGLKLRSEIWIDLERVATLGGDLPDIVTKLENKEVLEVSTGLFMSLEMTDGVHNGESFEGIWRDVVPDHLAILQEGHVGACSVEDGCGTQRVNSFQLSDCLCGTNCGGICMPKDKPTDNADPDPTTQKGIFQTLMDKFPDLLNFRGATSDISDIDTRAAILAALSVNQPDEFFFLVAVFDGSFVYEQGFSGTLKSRDFSISEDGTVSLSDDITDVRPETTFKPVTVNQEEDMTVNKERVDALISNEGTKFTEDDRSWLVGLEDEAFGKLEDLLSSKADPVVETTTTTEGEGEGTGDPVVEGDPAAAIKASGDDAAPQTEEEYINSAPSEMQEVLNSGLALHRQQKADIIKGLTSNERCAFNETELQDKSLEELEKLASLADVQIYTGRATPVANATPANDGFADPMPQAFDLKKAS